MKISRFQRPVLDSLKSFDGDLKREEYLKGDGEYIDASKGSNSCIHRGRFELN
jgi:hypothetical protein